MTSRSLYCYVALTDWSPRGSRLHKPWFERAGFAPRAMHRIDDVQRPRSLELLAGIGAADQRDVRERCWMQERATRVAPTLRHTAET